MGKRKKPEEIKRLLAEAERDLAKGLSVADVCRKVGVSEATYHRWRQRSSATQPDGSRQAKQLQSEVAGEGGGYEPVSCGEVGGLAGGDKTGRKMPGPTA